MRRQAAKHRKKRRTQAETHRRLWPILALAVAASLVGAMLTTRSAAEHRERTRRMAEHDSVRLYVVESARAAGRALAGQQAGPEAEGGDR